MKKLMYFFLIIGLLAMVTFAYDLAVNQVLDFVSIVLAIGMFSLAFVVQRKYIVETV